MKIKSMVIAPAALLAAVALVGCTGGDQPDEVEGSREKVIDVQDQPGSVEGYVGASDDAELTSCNMEDGALRVSGTVSNPESEPQDYRIYVSALESADTVGLVQVDVPDVSDSETWSTEIAYDGHDLECVLRVERFSAE